MTEQPPRLTAAAARRLRYALSDSNTVTESEIQRSCASVRRAHPDWSADQVRTAAMLRLARDEGIDW